VSSKPEAYVELLRQIEAAQEQDVIEQALTAARERLSMDASYITTMDEHGQRIDAVVGAIEGVPIVPDAVVPLDQTYCMRMLSGEIPNLIPDTRSEPAVRDLEASQRIRAYVGVPVTLSDGRVHGTLCCVSERPCTRLGGDELHFMRVLADMVAARVEHPQGDLTRSTERLRERPQAG
jgi:GAF domain-containing protein